LLDELAGREALQALLVDSRAWPLCVAQLEAGAEAAALLARVRGEDVCLRLDDGRLIVVLPSTGPAQAQALVQRLGALRDRGPLGETAPSCWLGLELQVAALGLGRGRDAHQARQRGREIVHLDACLDLALA
jgi:GGDEF domain-containing protein